MISGPCRFLRVHLAAWEDCKVMTEPGLLMDSTYSLPMAMIYSSPKLTERSRKNWHRYRAGPGGCAGRPTAHGYVFLWLTRQGEATPYGKCSPTELILMLCFKAGTLLPRNAAAIGHRTGITLSFNQLTTARRRFGRCPRKAAFSVRQNRPS